MGYFCSGLFLNRRQLVRAWQHAFSICLTRPYNKTTFLVFRGLNYRGFRHSFPSFQTWLIWGQWRGPEHTLGIKGLTIHIWRGQKERPRISVDKTGLPALVWKQRMVVRNVQNLPVPSLLEKRQGEEFRTSPDRKPYLPAPLHVVT